MSKHAEHLDVHFASERFEGPSATELHPQTKTSSLWFFYRETTNLKSVDDLAKQCVETQSEVIPVQLEGDWLTRQSVSGCSRTARESFCMRVECVCARVDFAVSQSQISSLLVLLTL